MSILQTSALYHTAKLILVTFFTNHAALNGYIQYLLELWFILNNGDEYLSVSMRDTGIRKKKNIFPFKHL